MGQASTAIAYLDGPRLLRAVSAGIHHVFQRREYLNRINVFPVPDGDTGTNLAFTFKTILESVSSTSHGRVDQMTSAIASAALDGARGNSGAIMAQYFHGFSEATAGRRLLTAEGFAGAAVAGAAAAWKAMSKPVPGTLPTVLEDFSDEVNEQVRGGVKDVRQLLSLGLERARKSLANTPNLLPVLRQAGVVDAGAQGFVDLLEGIWHYVESGRVDEVAADLPAPKPIDTAALEAGEHRYCTECLVQGEDLDRDAIMQCLAKLDSSSLVVAGGCARVKVHIHVNNPAEVFLACGEFGVITQQKADDMQRQRGLMNHSGKVAVVVDSGADIPTEEVDRLGINVVPVRLSFGDQEYLDRVSLTPERFYELLASSAETPLTSQPPTQDFSRVYSLLTSHGYDVISVGLSAQLSGTTAAAIQAAGRQEGGKVTVIDSLSATAGQGLLAMVAAEAAEAGMSAQEIEALLREMIPQTRVMAVANDLSYAVRGGRVPGWVRRVADVIRINPVLTASRTGKMGLAGFHRGRGANPVALARTAVRQMKDERMYRVSIAHARNPAGAAELRNEILRHHGRVHSCHVTDAGPALGVHFGPGALIVGFLPQPPVFD